MENKFITQADEHGNTFASLCYFLKFEIDKDSKILDLGCGYGSLVYNLYLNNYKNSYGIDVDKDKILIGKNSYPDISDNIQCNPAGVIPYNDNFFDIVLMFDVIEHIPEIEKFLEREVYRVMKKGGLFLFQTPNKWINIPWEIINNKSIKKWKTYHCSLQTRNKLKQMLKIIGFRGIVIEKYNVITEHNVIKVKRKLGYFGVALLYVFQKMPLAVYPNFWGSGIK